MGDSILNNSNYVNASDSVEEELKKNYPQIINLAQDGATLEDLDSQLNKLNKFQINDSSLVIVISIGGNDLLRKTDLTNKDLTKIYETKVNTILNQYPKAKIFILNLYFPPNSRFKKHYPNITEWNNNLNSLQNTNIKVISITHIITQNADLVFEIEPSKIGGKKIADSIANEIK